MPLSRRNRVKSISLYRHLLFQALYLIRVKNYSMIATTYGACRRGDMPYLRRRSILTHSYIARATLAMT